MPSTAKLIASSVTPGTPSTGSNVPMFGSVVGRLGVGGRVRRRVGGGVGRRVGGVGGRVGGGLRRRVGGGVGRGRRRSCRRSSRRRSSCRTRRGSGNSRRRRRAAVPTRIVADENWSRWAPLVEADPPAVPVLPENSTLIYGEHKFPYHSTGRRRAPSRRSRSSRQRRAVDRAHPMSRHGRLGSTQRDDASTEAAARHPGAEHAGLVEHRARPLRP